MNVIVTGLPYFASKIAKGLATFDRQNRYRYIDIYGGMTGKLRYVVHLLRGELLYLIGGDNRCGVSLFLALMLGKRIVMHWVGTDVLVARENLRSGKTNNFLLKNSSHLCETEWIQQELKEIGIDAKVAQIACIEPAPESELGFPVEFSILTYIGQGREDFYGMKKILEVARIFPDIPVRVVGIDSYEKEGGLPANVQLLGWVDNTRQEYQRCVLYLRLAEHDGLSFSVLEALSFGRYVGYSYPVEGAMHIVDHDSLVSFIEGLYDDFLRGALPANEFGRNVVLQRHSEDQVYRGLISVFSTAG